MDHVMFLLFRAYFITLMTVGMMASLTEFRFGRRKLLGIMAVYSAWVVGSSLALLYFGGELLLLRLFLVTISVPATALTYWAANDTPTQAVFNYMTQILLSVLAASVEGSEITTLEGVEKEAAEFGAFLANEGGGGFRLAACLFGCRIDLAAVVPKGGLAVGVAALPCL